MFSSFANPFHKSDKPLTEKGLAGVLHYAGKSSRDIAQFAEDNRVSANSLMAFGALLGDDFNDVTNKLGNMLHQWSNIMMEFSDSIDQYRDMLKIISLKEASLLPSREQKRRIREKIDQLQGSLVAMDKISNLQDQLEQLETVTESDEIEMDNFRRTTTSKALYTFLDGMSAMAGKTNIISTFGKNLVDELHIVPLKPGLERPVYQSEEKTKHVVEYVQKSIYEWNQQTPELNQKVYHGHNSKQLPPVPIKSVSATSSTTPSPTTSTNNKSDKAVFPPRHVSLEEQHKQYSFYKPDQVDDDDNEPSSITTTTTNNNNNSSPDPSYQPHLTQSTNSTTTTTTTKAPLQNNEGGFSNIYLNTHHQHQQQQQYLPNREYEELASSFNSDAVFRGSDDRRKSQRNDAGGFVLPSANPNYIYPSNSTQSANSTKSTDSVTE
ncbi:Eisosome component PIL1-domain-containing protein [Thamnidium elegans]|nr:Eisosome component PIL1-domain-containing protein [Thamnidium elegans]